MNERGCWWKARTNAAHESVPQLMYLPSEFFESLTNTVVSPRTSRQFPESSE